jgi:hypothetical protein
MINYPMLKERGFVLQNDIVRPVEASRVMSGGEYSKFLRECLSQYQVDKGGWLAADVERFCEGSNVQL